MFAGSMVALVTPMNDDLSIDYDSYLKLIGECINAGK